MTPVSSLNTRFAVAQRLLPDVERELGTVPSWHDRRQPEAPARSIDQDTRADGRDRMQDQVHPRRGGTLRGCDGEAGSSIVDVIRNQE